MSDFNSVPSEKKEGNRQDNRGLVEYRWIVLGVLSPTQCVQVLYCALSVMYRAEPTTGKYSFIVLRDYVGNISISDIY